MKTGQDLTFLTFPSIQEKNSRFRCLTIFRSTQNRKHQWKSAAKHRWII